MKVPNNILFFIDRNVYAARNLQTHMSCYKIIQLLLTYITYNRGGKLSFYIYIIYKLFTKCK